MYIPAAFRESDTALLHEFIQSHGFATVMTDGSAGLMASHLPILLDPSRGPHGTLFGHFARANEHAAEMGAETLVVFSGPHAYISPTWYETPNTVPTWNYVAVHATGVLEPVADRDALAEILRATVDKYERSQPVPWSFDSGTEFHQKLMDAIVGFQITITRLEGKWKLNQNHPRERRQKVVDALKTAGGEDRQEIAALMQESITAPV
ncbi:MAG: FMN-binding negative transcriptional regulator [Planctomycetes bacterium]|nr:FMN-binding negative transcriptional regulator [Planctomycetota bacterium]